MENGENRENRDNTANKANTADTAQANTANAANAADATQVNTAEEIQRIIDEVINGQLELHGGSARLSRFEDGVAWIKFLGACSSCMSASDTLETVVRTEIMERLPQVRDVQLDTSVSDDLLDFARKILSGQVQT